MADSMSPQNEVSPEEQEAKPQDKHDELRCEMLWLKQRLAQLEERLEKDLAPLPVAHPEMRPRPIVPNVSPPFPAPPLSPLIEKSEPSPRIESLDWQKIVPPLPEPCAETKAPSKTSQEKLAPPPAQPPYESAPQKTVHKEASVTGSQARTDQHNHQRSGLDWENLIGGQWALWIGSFSLFLAVASLLALTWKHFQPPPAAKIALGLAAGLSMIGGGGFWRARTQRWFSEGMTGAGLAICYLSLWASVLPSLHVLSRESAFGSMAALTALGVYLAVRYDALSLVVLSTIGGFLTPVLLRSHGGDAHSLTLLIYIAVLDAGIVAVSVFRRWNSVKWLSFLATIVLLLIWSTGVNFDQMRVPIVGFSTLYFLLFLGAACFHSLVRAEETADGDLLLLFGASSVYAVVGHALLVPLMGKFPGTFPLAMALFFGCLGILVLARAPQNKSLRWSVNGLALLAFTLAIPVQFQQQSWLAVGWVIEAGVLLIVSRRLQSILMQRAGQIVAALSLWPLLASLWNAPITPELLFLNARALPLLASAMMAGFVAWDAQRANKNWHDELTPLYGSFAVLGGAWLLAQETYLHFLWQGRNSVAPETPFAISIVLAFYALAVFLGGRKGHHAVFRLNALIVALLAGALPLWSGFTKETPLWMPFWNWRVLAFGVVTLVWLVLGYFLQNEEAARGENEAEAFSFWPVLAAVIALTGASLEVYFGFAFEHLQSDTQWQARAFFTLVMLWSAASVVLAWLGSLWRVSGLRVLAYVLGMGAIATLLFDAVFSGLHTLPLWNLRLGAFSFAVVACLLVSSAVNRAENAAHEELPLPDLGLQLAALLTLWGTTHEIYETCRYMHAALGDGWRLTAFYGIAMFWALFATLLMHLPKQPALPPLSYIAAIGSVGLLLFQATAFNLTTRPLLNVRFLAFTVVIASLWAMARRLRATAAIAGWEQGLASQLTLEVALLTLWGLTQETFEACRFYQGNLGLHWDNVAWFATAILWQCGAFGLLVIGLRRREFSLRGAAYLLGLAGGVALLLNTTTTSHFDWTPFSNARALAYALTFGLWFGGALVMQNYRSDLQENESGWIRPLGLFAIVVLGLGLTQETLETCYFFREHLAPHWGRWAQMAISLVWSVYGALMLIGGIAKSYQPLRLAALALLSATVCKVFLFDLSFLDGPLRILSLAGLGGALIFISWLYGRFGRRPNLGNQGVNYASPKNS